MQNLLVSFTFMVKLKRWNSTEQNNQKSQANETEKESKKQKQH